MSRDDILAAQEDELTSGEEQQAQEEAHHHFTGTEFSHMVEHLGPSHALSFLTEDAVGELRSKFLNEYHHRLIETVGL